MEQNKNKKKNQQTTPPFEGPYTTKPSAIAGKHGIGFSTARHLARLGMKKVTKEDVDGCPVCGQDSCKCNHVQEVSSELLDRYKTGAKKSAEDLAAKGNYKKSNDRWLGVMRATGKQIGKTASNIRKALNREEVEQVDELKKSTLGSYVNKAADSAAMHAYGAGGESQSHAGTPVSKRPDTYGSDRKIALKRLRGIAKATSRLTKEEIELVDEQSLKDVEAKWKPYNARGSNPVQKASIQQPPKANSSHEAAMKAHIAASVKRKMEDEKQGRDSASGKSYNEEVEMSDNSFSKLRLNLAEKTLTPAEKKKREEVAKAIERENPGMPMGMKMAIATKTAKRVAEEVELDEAKSLASMSMDELKAKHDEVTKKINDAGRSKMISMNHPLSQQRRAIKLHMMIKQQKAAKGMSEEIDQQEDQHYCAKHVRSSILGDGVVLEAQHAEPDENGNIEWYMVEFTDGIHKVYTEDLEIMIAEFHGNHTKKKKR